ncbi:hypothetical protein P3T76_012555 [Phytophthora citrophthora]|uniref:Uncharacterized protein n=1 Tax=Phytophthora citrophthora TaxID=4793 RepID=A0AAD9G5A0_9STRA|nr:hypothetical protein P3T76_012555 [Phytophthora citrophthora]
MQKPQNSAGTRLSATSNAFNARRRLLTLQEVERVLVSRASSRASLFTLKVYTDTSAPRPSLFDGDLLRDSVGSQLPASTYQVDKTLVDFDNLRQALYNASHLAHTSVSCEFCKEMMLYLETGEKKFDSNVLRLLVGREKIIRSLQQFVDNVIDILIHFACIEGTPWCSGQVQSHQIVQQFLRPRAPDS